MQRLSRAGLAILVLTSIAVSQSQADAVGALSATSLATESPGTLKSSLAGIVLANSSIESALDAELEVRNGTLTLDQEVVGAYAAGVGVTPANQSSETRSLSGEVAQFQLQEYHRVLFLPVDTTRLQSEIGTQKNEFAASPLQRTSFAARISNTRPDVQADFSGIQWHTTGSTIMIAAPFAVVVWGADFVVTQQGREEQIRTGSRFEPAAQGVPGPAVGRYVGAEAFLKVTEGSLTLQANEGFAIYLQQLELQLKQGQVECREPKGVLPIEDATVPPGSRVLVLEGPFIANLAAVNGHVALDFTAPPNQVNLDGAVIRTSAGWPTWMWGLGLLLLVMVPVGVKAVQHMWVRQQLHLLDSHVVSRRFDEALNVARRIRRRKPGSGDAIVAEILSLLHRKRYVEADAVMAYEPWPLGLEVLRDYLRAAAAAGQGRLEDARRHLRACLQKSPGMAREAAMHPDLAPLLAQIRTH